MAVAFVTLNRVKSTHFPNTVCDVVIQRNGRGCQFSWFCDTKSDQPREKLIWEAIYELAKSFNIARPVDFTGGATYYHTDYVTPRWSSKLAFTRKIGAHLFYRR